MRKYTHAIDRLEFLGLPSEVNHNLINQISIWIESSGPEWTVQRLKTLKTYFLHFISGQKDKSPEWLAVDAEGLPKGPFGYLFRRGACRKVFDTLLIYTSLTAPAPTPSQKKKFFESVTVEPLIRLPHIPNLKSAVEDIRPLLPERVVIPFYKYPFSVTKMGPDKSMKSKPETLDLLYEDFTSQIVWDYLDDIELEGVFAEHLDYIYPDLLKVDEDGDNLYGTCVGKVSQIQEPGYKMRAIANPRRVFQVVLRSMGKQLFKLLKRLPWDCTHRQSDGINWVQTQLQAGKVVHSVDLSDATNNFPLALQERILTWLGIHHGDLKLFCMVSRGDWYVPKYLTQQVEYCTITNAQTLTTVQWTKGQPLGLYPSFATFALSHGLLVRSIEKSHGLSDTFRVLGDDIVINSNLVARDYRKFLSLLQCPISEQKTIESSVIAEFAGAIISKDTTYLGAKWRVPNKLNKLSLLASLPGDCGTGKYPLVASLLRSLPEPYGSDRNPDGLPLHVRASLLRPIILQWIEDEELDEVPLERHSKYEVWRNSSYYSPSELKMTRKELDEWINNLNLSHPDEATPVARGSDICVALAKYYRFPKMLFPRQHLDTLFKEGDECWGLVEAILEESPSKSPFDIIWRKMYKGQLDSYRLSKNILHKQIQNCINFISDYEV